MWLTTYGKIRHHKPEDQNVNYAQVIMLCLFAYKHNPDGSEV
jgi:hypothetical protein